VAIMLCVNLLPKPYSENEWIVLDEVSMPTIRLAFEDAKLISNEMTENEILLKYDANSVAIEKLVEFRELLKRYGYRVIKDNFVAEENKAEFVVVSWAGEEKISYIKVISNNKEVSITYSVTPGKLEVIKPEKFIFYDLEKQYYDITIDDQLIKVPSLDNVVKLTRDNDSDFIAQNYMWIRYNYDEHTTSEQKKAYLKKYGEFLIENGYSQGKNERQFVNGVVKVDLDDGYAFYVTISKDNVT